MTTVGPAHLAPRIGELYTHTAIRGAAALCVVGYHAMLGVTGKGFTDNVIANFFLSSFLFVDFFFILSGFIMTENYGAKFHDAGPSLLLVKSYYKKRALKILPNYYFWLIVSIALWFLKEIYFEEKIDASRCIYVSVFQHFLLIQNFIGSCFYFNTPLWSIAVEFLAYLVFPIIIFLRLPALKLLSVAITMYVFILYNHTTIDIIEGSLSAIRCFAGFLCGMALAGFQRINSSGVTHVFLSIVLLASLSRGLEAISIAIMAAFTLATTQNTGALAVFSRQKIPYGIGRASFSIYLAHIPVSMVVDPIAYKLEVETGFPFGSDWTYALPTKIGLSVLVGIWAYRQIESRFADVAARW